MVALASTVQNIAKIPELRRKLAITFLLLAVYRIGFYVYLPYVDAQVLNEIIRQTADSGLGALMDFAGSITGGELRNCTLFALGIMPYISAAIIFQLLVKVIPALEQLQKEGAAGRQKITQYTRYATVGLCMIQSLFIVQWMTGEFPGGRHIVPEGAQTFGFYITTMVSLTTGTIFLMWLGEQISEYGIGNGISLLIMAGIVARLPGALNNFVVGIIGAETQQVVAFEVLKLVLFFVLFMAITIGVVLMTLGQRRIPVQQGKHNRGRRVYGGQRHYMPLKVNAAGVMPIIFAQSLLIIPTVLFSYIGIASIRAIFQSQGFVYHFLYIGLIAFFTYFWTSLTFNPVEMANNMKDYGSFVPGIRPGRKTAEYLEYIMNRITLVGTVFLVFISLFPNVVTSISGLDLNLSDFLGGTGILIVVGVALDLVQKVESHLLVRQYDGFMKGGRGH